MSPSPGTLWVWGKAGMGVRDSRMPLLPSSSPAPRGYPGRRVFTRRLRVNNCGPGGLEPVVDQRFDARAPMVRPGLWEKSKRTENALKHSIGQARFPRSAPTRASTGGRIGSVWDASSSSDRQPCESCRRATSKLHRFLQHHLNALHVMAILVRLGVPRTWAMAVARGWERVSRWWLYAADE
jgi:hypothetical protein